MKNILLTIAVIVLSAELGAQPMHACDWESAHPSDPDRVGPGRSSSEVDTTRAKVACREAVTSYPDTARFHYQLGRAIVYEADRAGTDWHEGMPYLIKAANMKHTQAEFVLGLMYQRDAKLCEAETWTRRAADKGLKSARISYVSDYLAERISDCDGAADLTTLQDYLDGARSQVNGWYENMLLDNLLRELGAHISAAASD